MLSPLVRGGEAGVDGLPICGVFGISDTGVIVGRGLHDGVIAVFLLTPVPKPASLGAVAPAGLALRRRRRA